MISIFCICMAKGNQCINKSIAKEVEDGKVIQDIPETEHSIKMFQLFTVIQHTVLCVEVK
jgi:hypothetical protein